MKMPLATNRWLVLVWGLVCVPPASAESTWLWGGEGGNRYAYAYLGYAAPLAGKAGDDGYLQRYWLDWVEYRYDKAGREISAKAPGAEALLGRRLAASGGRELAIYGGVTYRDTDISPSDADVDVAGGQWGAKVQVEGALAAPRRRLEGIAAYIGGPNAYWVRGRALFGAATGYRFGAEAVALGDPDYDAYQVGLLVSGFFHGSSGQWLLKAGARDSGGQGLRGYAGIEMLFARW